MKLPIFAIENGGDITAFKSIEQAEQYLEAQDIVAGTYEIYDSNGGIFRQLIETEERRFLWLWRVRIGKTRLRFIEENAQGIFYQHLKRFLEKVDASITSSELSLEKMVEKIVPFVLIS